MQRAGVPRVCLKRQHDLAWGRKSTTKPLKELSVTQRKRTLALGNAMFCSVTHLRCGNHGLQSGQACTFALGRNFTTKSFTTVEVAAAQYGWVKAATVQVAESASVKKPARYGCDHRVAAVGRPVWFARVVFGGFCSGLRRRFGVPGKCTVSGLSSCGNSKEPQESLEFCRRSFGDPRTRPSAVGVARRHSPSVHWWQQASERGQPKRVAR